jgi:hypothetical protein
MFAQGRAMTTFIPPPGGRSAHDVRGPTVSERLNQLAEGERRLLLRILDYSEGEESDLTRTARSTCQRVL